ncbi:MAG: sn-glycerol-3-phosphate ABC transporter permease UgpA [Pseudomonadota bacterium]
MADRRAIFGSRTLPYALLAPQLIVTAVFFLWPAWQALEQSVFLEDAFGFSRRFVGADNFTGLLDDPSYLRSFSTTFIFAAVVTGLCMSIALVLALAANRVIRLSSGYKMLLVWPYAVAPALTGVLFYFLMNPSIGVVAQWLRSLGTEWDPFLNGSHAFTLIVVAACWKQLSYNFLFFLAGLQSIPKSLVEAAALDGASPTRRLWTLIIPLLSPTVFFLLVMNLLYAFFDTFGLIHATTEGGPSDATTILVLKVYQSGFIGQDYGGSAAQSVILMTMVILLTMVQFRYIERKVVYA